MDTRHSTTAARGVAVAACALTLGAVVVGVGAAGNDASGDAEIATPFQPVEATAIDGSDAGPASETTAPEASLEQGDESNPNDVPPQAPNEPAVDTGAATNPTPDEASSETPVSSDAEDPAEISDVDDEDAEDDDFGDDGEPIIETVGPASIGSTDPEVTWATFDLVADGGQASPSPCDHAAALGQSLIASPAEAFLPPTGDTVDIAFTWCGDAETAMTPQQGVGAAWNSKGTTTIQPGETIEFSLYVDRTEFPIGGFTTQASYAVTGGETRTVTVNGMSYGTVLAPAAAGNFTIGDGAPGCSDSCISTATLVPSAASTQVGLDVTTKVPATFELYVFQQMPYLIDGVPAVVGATPVATSSALDTAWSSDLGDLAPDTTYHLLLGATDEQDRTQWVTHSFTSLAPAANYAGNDPDPGCAAACIIEAKLSPTGSYDSVDLHVETHTEAKIVAKVGTNLTWQNDQPVISAPITEATFHEYETSWDTTFEGLEGDTDYHIAVWATDDNGNTHVEVGQFHTDQAPPTGVLVRFEKVLITWDADRSSVNRGELRFAWGVDDIKLGTRGESKHHTGNQITLETNTDGWLVTFDGNQERLMTLAGGERDPEGVGPPCQAELSESPLWRQQNRHECGNIKWNTAPMTMTLEEIAELPYCSDYNIEGTAGNRRCHDIGTPNYGDDVPRFTSIVSFEVFD